MRGNALGLTSIVADPLNIDISISQFDRDLIVAKGMEGMPMKLGHSAIAVGIILLSG